MKGSGYKNKKCTAKKKSDKINEHTNYESRECTKPIYLFRIFERFVIRM